MGRLIAVSNRTAAGSGSRAGGLAVALWDALAQTESLWFGWSGDLVDQDARGVRMIAEGGVDYALADLTESEHEGFYLGFANRTLWPVFHYRTDLAVFDETDFRTYEDVNRRLSQLLHHQMRDGDVVWVHDYQFIMFAEGLRQAGWYGRIGFFLHIPFPPPEIFRTIPEHTRLSQALANYDVIGFQTDGDTNNFLRYLSEDAADFRADGARVHAFGRTMTVATYPIGIDADAFAAMAVSDDAQAAVERISSFLGDRSLVIGVDRMDYSKGLPQRFEAIGRLFDNYKDVHGEVSFTQISPPSRSKVEAYMDLRAQLDGLAGRINADYGDLDWIPIRYLARSYSREQLAGLFRIAKVGLVTPLRDGMNLVAQEYIAAQDPENPGVLILSEFAGASDQLRNALLVNPHDVNAVSETIRTALQMPLSERRKRWEDCRDVVWKNDVASWRRSFLDALTDPVDTATIRS